MFINRLFPILIFIQSILQGQVINLKFDLFVEVQIGISLLQKFVFDTHKQIEQVFMSITKSGIVQIFTSNTLQSQLDKEMKKLKRVKQMIKKRKTQLFINRQQLGHTKKSIASQASTKDIKENCPMQSKRLQKFKELSDHVQSLKSLQKKYMTNFQNGLNEVQALNRLQQSGQNIITQKNKTPQILLFLKEMSDPFSLLLWFLTILSFIYYGFSVDSNGLMLCLILLIVLFGGATIQYLYNKNSAQTIDSIKSIMPLFCNVIREATQRNILVQKLVKGDIVAITPGMKIPADLRIIQCSGLRSDNSVYTGQSKPVYNSVDHNDQTNPFIAKNMMYSGAINVQGTGKGLVINTGNNILFSQISYILLSEQQKPKYIQAQMQRFVIVVTLFSLGIGIFTFVGGYLTGFRLIIAVMIAIGVAVASVPGVLNLQVTVMFTLAVRKLAQRNIICKNLYIIQNLGSTSCLCTDKTGTLTKNQQTVSYLWMNNKLHKCINKEDFGPNYYYDYDQTDPLFTDIQKCAILTSIAKFQASPSKKEIQGIYSRKDITNLEKVVQQKELRTNWAVKTQHLNYTQRSMVGNPTEIALSYFFQPIKDIRFLREENPYYYLPTRQKAIKTFKSQDKYSMSINKDQDQEYYIYTKGAPQIIWDMCRYVFLNGKVIQKQFFHTTFDSAVQKFADRGQTVVAFSKMKFREPQRKRVQISPPNFQYQEQIFLGMISFQDPPKKGVPQTIQRIRVAGIKVVMITGDQQKIATKIAKKCNIITQARTVNQIMLEENIPFQDAFMKSQALVITGSQIDSILASEQIMMPQQKQKAIMRLLDKKQVIFAKTTPSHKMYIVQILQKMGHMVTVTGDGTNDSAALKIANCGICMGSGSDIAKDCADIIISDDDFNKILEGIQEGRKLFDNLKKAIVYVMTSQIQQFMPFILLIFSKIPIPIFTLLIDAPIDFVPTVSYVYQDCEADLMTRKPKDPTSPLVSARLLGQASGWMGFSGFLCNMACYYICMIDFGFIPSQLWQKNNMPMILPNTSDHYNPSDKYLGNTNLVNIKTCQEFDSNVITTDFINSIYPWVDIRMSSVICHTKADKTIQFFPIMVYGQCRVQQISVYTGKPVCFTSQSTKYGQTSYMYGNVIAQVFNLFMCKSSRESALSIRINNKVMIFGIALQIMFALALSQFWYLIVLIGTRDNIYMHYGLPALLFGIIQFTIDQFRKWCIRNLPRDNFGQLKRKYQQCRPNWFQRNTKW